MSARQPPTVLSSAARKRRERERAEKRKSELQALLKWHMDRMPAEAPRDRASVSGEARESKRKSIDPMVLLEDCITVMKRSPWLLKEGAEAIPETVSQGTGSECPGEGVPLQQLPELYPGSQMYRAGLMLSKTLGVFVIQTATMCVLEGNRALENFWMLPGMMQGQRSLAGQSIWALIDWNDHDAISEMQGMFQRKDASVIGRSFYLGLIRITKNTEVGSISKIVHRHVEVIYMSDDGSTAQLGVYMHEEDDNALRLGEDWVGLSKETHTFKIDFWNPEPQAPVDPMADTSLQGTDQSFFPGISILRFEQMVDTMWKMTPSIYIINGPDDDGVLRHMAFSKLSLSQTFSQSAVPFIPLVNVRLGDCRHSKDMRAVGGETSKELGWESWMLLSEKDLEWSQQSQESAWDRHASTFRFLQAVFSRTWGAPNVPPKDVLIGYAMASKKGIKAVRIATGNETGKRPTVTRSPKVRIWSQWDGMEQDIKSIKAIFSFWEGQPQFLDLSSS